MILLERLLGFSGPFYGAVDHRFRIGDLVFDVLEDPDDGYRSSLGSVRILDLTVSNAIDGEEARAIAGLPSKPFASVTLREAPEGACGFEEFDGWELADDSGHVWLTFGTGRYDEWYPCFVFEYTPRVAMA